MSREHQLVLYTHGGGRLGNQIIRWAHWQAWAQENVQCVEVINLAFWPYAALFMGSRKHPGCVAPESKQLTDWMARGRGVLPPWVLRRWDRRIPLHVHRLGRLCPGAQSIALTEHSDERINLDGDELLQRLEGHWLTLCSGWRFSGWERVRRRQADLRNYFQPDTRRAKQAQSVIARLRRSCDILFGVLIRQTDYRVWRGGRFFYKVGDYARWMRQIRDLHPGCRVGFLVTSDELQAAASFAGIRCEFASGSVNAGGEAIESFIELSLCDGIISPPSTFAATAAFVGGKPLWPLMDPRQDLALDQIIEDALWGAAQHPVFSLAVN